MDFDVGIKAAERITASNAPLTVFTLIVLFFIAWMLYVSLRRTRVSLELRIEDCEDSHASRDIIQMRMVHLIGHSTATIRTLIADKELAASLEAEVDELLGEVREYHEQALLRRQASRANRRALEQQLHSMGLARTRKEDKNGRDN